MLRSRYRKIIIMLCLLAFVLAGCSMRKNPTSQDQPVGSFQEPEPGKQPDKQPDKAPQGGDDDEYSTPTDIRDPDEYPASGTDLPEETVDPNAWAGPDLELREKVEDDFFDDAVFFGNSLVNGLELYGKMQGGDFCAATSASVISVTSTKNACLNNGMAATLLDAMLEEQYGKIYILLGINEIGFNTDYFSDVYSDMLSRIKEAQPEATIYIMSLTPVTKAKSDAGAPFTMERIHEYNDALYQLAVEHQCYYVDLIEALADSTGYLPASDSTDGVHFVVSKYSVWADYLRTHYAGDPEDVKKFDVPEEEDEPVWYPPVEESPQPSPEPEQPQPSPEPSPEATPEPTPPPGTATDLVPQE